MKTRIGLLLMALVMCCRSTAGNRWPHVEISGSTRTAYVGVARTVYAEATDEDGFVRRVVFYADEVKLGEDETAPYSAQILPKGIGTIVVTAIAIDDDDGRSRAASAEYTVTECPSTGMVCGEELSFEDCCAPLPIVHWIGPKPNQRHEARAAIVLEVSVKSEDFPITKVEFLRDGRVIGTVSTPPYRFAWKDVPAGAYNIEVRATTTLRMFGWSTPNTIVVVDRAKERAP